ncbi:MAG: DNA repair protein RecN [Desulfuromonadales bacterium]|nr:DNA repair protein RecN [Desulfuromonadales bacterium]
MLVHLTITNFAIIDRLEVEFGSGFNVLTGETGAGKSIVMDALGLLLGDRASPELIRAGCEEATVEALFDLTGRSDLQAVINAAGFSAGSELILRRVITRAGRSRAYINGGLATLTQLQPLTEQLVAVCGQHEHQALMGRDAHLPLVDTFGGHEALNCEYRELFAAWRATGEHLARLSEAERERARRLDLLRYQAREIGEARLQPGEEEELAAERLLLQNAERLAAAANNGYETLYAADGAVCAALGRMAGELEGLAGIDPELGQLAETLRQSLYTLEDVAAQLRSHLNRIGCEPGRQEEVEERLALLTALKRKYGASVAEILEQQAAIVTELDELEHAEETRAALEAELVGQLTALLDVGSRLGAARREAGERLGAAMQRELADLSMAGARFELQLTELPEPGPLGLERGEFLLAPNRGEALLPLARIASGGELSRILLALKRVTPGREQVPTLVFDEVDAGIGGATATAVGDKLRAVSRNAQVLCVTHLPQVAAGADRHFLVVKRELAGRTVTGIEPLAGEARVAEMARMLGGAQVTERSLAHARELIGAPPQG